MEVISTTLFPRCLPTWLHQGEAITIVGQVVNLDETARKVVIQPDPESTTPPIQINSQSKSTYHNPWKVQNSEMSNTLKYEELASHIKKSH